MIIIDQVVDPETKSVLGQGGRGELCVRGPQIMKGYLHNQEDSHTSKDEDGWLHTGMYPRVLYFKSGNEAPCDSDNYSLG